MILSLSLVAALLAAPAAAQPSADSAALQAEAASVEKAADSAASAADSANKAANAAEKAAEAAEKAAEAAATAAQAAQKAAQNSTMNAPPPTPNNPASASTAIPAPPPPVIWTSVINLGLISLTGNSQTLAFTFGGNVQRKSEDWIWAAKGNAIYGQSRDNTTGIESVNAEAASLQIRGDKRVSPVFSGYLLAGVDTDHIKSIEERPYGEIGASLVWFDIKDGDLERSILRTDLGFRYGREYRFQYYPYAVNLGEVDIVAPHLGLGYRSAINKEMIFTNDLDLTENVEGDARLLLINTAKLAARLTSSLNLTVSFIVNYDSLPPPPKLTTDTALTIGVEIAM